MTLTTRKYKSKCGKGHYEIVAVRMVNGKVKVTYPGYLDKGPRSKTEISYRETMRYENRLTGHKICGSKAY